MGLRNTASRLAGAPIAILLDDALRVIVDETVDARVLVRRDEVDALGARLDDLRRQLAETAQDLEAVRQAVDAVHAGLSDPELDAELGLGTNVESVDAAETQRAATHKRVDRLAGAAAELTDRLTALERTTVQARERADKAHQLATTARATAEAAADGVADLEADAT